MRVHLFFLFILSTLATSIACASSGVYDFESDDLRKSYQRLTEELRCPKCQNQNLADSNSEISDIMRDVIAESLADGKSEQQIKTTMVERYGDFVLYKPPVTVETMALWWAPMVFLGVAALVFVFIVAKRKKLNAEH